MRAPMASGRLGRRLSSCGIPPQGNVQERIRMLSDLSTNRPDEPVRTVTAVRPDSPTSAGPAHAAHRHPRSIRTTTHRTPRPRSPGWPCWRTGPSGTPSATSWSTAWLPMAHRIAGRFRDRGESIEDLRQVAAMGLVKAIDRYDPSRGAFESYAVPTITGEVKRHFRDRMWALRVPRRVQELRNKVRLARRDLTLNPGSPGADGGPDRGAHRADRGRGRCGDGGDGELQHAVPGRRTRLRGRQLQPRGHPGRRRILLRRWSSTAKRPRKGCAGCPNASGPSSTCASSRT